jgi:hypothetical protein
MIQWMKEIIQKAEFIPIKTEERGNHECYCIEWKREGEERGNVEIAGFAFEGTL